MSKQEHRLGVDEVNLVVRHLKLQEFDEEAIAKAMGEINEIYGMDEISLDKESHVLNFSYDATRTCIDCIEDILEKNNIAISHDWWTHFKEGYYLFVDQNVKDNATHEPFSCHKIPPHK